MTLWSCHADLILNRKTESEFHSFRNEENRWPRGLGRAPYGYKASEQAVHPVSIQGATLQPHFTMKSFHFFPLKYLHTLPQNDNMKKVGFIYLFANLFRIKN